MILSLTKILAGPIVIYSGEKKELFTFYVSHLGRKGQCGHLYQSFLIKRQKAFQQLI